MFAITHLPWSAVEYATLRRGLFNFAAAVSLLMCLGTVGLWARQFNKTLAIGNHYTTVTVETADCFYVSLWKYAFDVQAHSHFERPFIRFSGDGWLVAGVRTDGLDTRQISVARNRFFNEPREQSLVITQYFVKLPFWLLAAAFFVLPFHWLVSRHWQSLSIGRCDVCGYNLKGNVSGVCPECGTPVADLRGGRVTTEKSPAK